MPWWNKSKRKMLTKIIALMVSLTFIQPLVTFAFNPLTYPQPGLPFSTINYMGKTVKLPVKKAAVVGTYQGSPKTVICIQDLHCNYEVQKNIASTLDYLVKRLGLRLIGEEGAFGDLPTGVIKDFPNRKIKEEVADHFVRQGKLTGAEYFTVTTSAPVQLIGIEDKSLYNDSLARVHHFLNAESQGFIYDIRDQLDILKNKIYNHGLKKLDQKAMAYRMGDLGLLNYAAYLSQLARSLKVDLKPYALFNRFVMLHQDFFAPEMEADALYRQVDQVEAALRQVSYDNEAQKTLDNLYHRLYIMERLLNISVSQDELADFRQHRTQFKTNVYDAFLQAQGTLGLDSSFDTLDRYLQEAGEFYNLADQRSQAFVNNLSRAMDKGKQSLAVMINGGFHSEKVLAYLEQKNISYLSVRPQLTKLDIINPYFELLQGKKTPLEKLLAKNQNILAVKSALLDPVFRHLTELMVKVMAKTEGVESGAYSELYKSVSLSHLQPTAHWSRVTTSLDDLVGVLVFKANKKLTKLSKQLNAIEVTTIGNRIIAFFSNANQTQQAATLVDKAIAPTWQSTLLGIVETVLGAKAPGWKHAGFINFNLLTSSRWALGFLATTTAIIMFATHQELSVANLALFSLGLTTMMPEGVISLIQAGFEQAYARKLSRSRLYYPHHQVTLKPSGDIEEENDPTLRQLIQQKTTFLLESQRGEEIKRITGDALKIEGKWYLRLGDRWVGVENEDFADSMIRYGDLFTSHFLLGNKQLQMLLGLDSNSLPTLAPIPEEFETATEIQGLFLNEYTGNQRLQAINFIQSTNIINLAKKGELNRTTLMHYLDAFIVVSHKRVAAYDEFIEARQNLLLLLNLNEVLPGKHLTSTQETMIKENLVFGEKRKLGFPQLLLDMIVRNPSIKKLIKTKADGRVSFLAQDGRIREIDLANETYWGTPLDQDEMMAQIKKQADQAGYHWQKYMTDKFPYAPLVPTGGMATRIAKVHFNQNKLFGLMLRIKMGQEQKALEYFKTKGFDQFELEYFGDYAYIAITPLVLSMNPQATIVMGGLATIVPLESWFGGYAARTSLLETQDTLHPLTTEGEIMTDTLINGGHGRIITGFFSNKDKIAELLDEGYVLRYNQADDKGDRTLGHLMSRLLKLGQAAMAVISTPQAVSIKFNIKEIQDALKQGEKITYKGHAVKAVSDEALELVNGDKVALQPIKAGLQQALDRTNALKAEAEQLTGPAQRDKRIDAMKYYKEHIYDKLSEYLLKNSKDKAVILIEAKFNQGGEIVDVDNQSNFYEKSEYIQEDGDNIYRDSHGQKHAFPLPVVLAVDFKDFNSNNLSLDLLAFMAVMDHKAKDAYFDFLRASAQVLSESELLARRQQAEKEVAAIAKNMDTDVWEARLQVFERLMFALAAPPIEIKEGNVNLNMMAQNVSRLAAQIGLSDITMENIDIRNVEQVLNAAASRETFTAQAAYKNGQFKNLEGQTLSFARSSRLDGVPVKTLAQIRGRNDQASQVKGSTDFDPFAHQINESLMAMGESPFLAETEIGEGRVVNMELNQRQAVNLWEWMHKEGKDIVTPNVKRVLERMLGLIARHGGSLPEGAFPKSVKNYSRMLHFMHYLLPLVIEKDPVKKRLAEQSLSKGFQEAEKEGGLMTTQTLISRFQAGQQQLDATIQIGGLIGGFLLLAGVVTVASGLFISGWVVLLPVGLAVLGSLLAKPYLVAVWQTGELARWRLDLQYRIKRLLHYLSHQPLAAKLTFWLAIGISHLWQPLRDKIIIHIPMINTLLLIDPVYQMLAADHSVMTMQQAKDEISHQYRMEMFNDKNLNAQEQTKRIARFNTAVAQASEIFENQVMNNPQIRVLADLEDDFSPEVKKVLEHFFAKHRLLVTYPQELTETNVAMQLGVSEHAAQLALELLNGIPAQKTKWKNITKKLSKGNQMVYYQLKEKPVDLKNVHVVLMLGGGMESLLPVNTRQWKSNVPTLLQKQLGLLAELKIPLAHTHIICNDSQEKDIRTNLPEDFPRGNLLSQPLMGGSAATYGLMLEKIRLEAGEDGVVMFMPAKNLIGDYNQFKKTLDDALKSAVDQDRVTAIGLPSQEVIDNVGYMQEGVKLKGSGGLYQVNALFEKPDTTAARQLVRQGALVNTGIYLMRVEHGLRLYREASPILYDWMKRVIRKGFEEGSMRAQIGSYFALLSDKARVEAARLFATIIPENRAGFAMLAVDPKISWTPEPIMSEAKDFNGNIKIGLGEFNQQDSHNNVVFADENINLTLHEVNGYYVMAPANRGILLVVPVAARQKIGEIFSQLGQNPDLEPYLKGGAVPDEVIARHKGEIKYDNSNTIRGLGTVISSTNVHLDSGKGMVVTISAENLSITRKGDDITITHLAPHTVAAGGTMSWLEAPLMKLFGIQSSTFVKYLAPALELFPLAISYILYGLVTGDWTMAAAPLSAMFAAFGLYSLPRVGMFTRLHDFRDMSEMPADVFEARKAQAEKLSTINTMALALLFTASQLLAVSATTATAVLLAMWLVSHYVANNLNSTTASSAKKSKSLGEFLGLVEDPNVEQLRDKPLGEIIYQAVYGVNQALGNLVLGEKFNWAKNIMVARGAGFAVTDKIIDKQARRQAGQPLKADQKMVELTVPAWFYDLQMKGQPLNLLQKMEIRLRFKAAMNHYRRTILSEQRSVSNETAEIYGRQPLWTLAMNLKNTIQTYARAHGLSSEKEVYGSLGTGKTMAMVGTQLALVLDHLMRLQGSQGVWQGAKLADKVEAVLGAGFANLDPAYAAEAILAMDDHAIAAINDEAVQGLLASTKAMIAEAGDNSLLREAVVQHLKALFVHEAQLSTVTLKLASVDEGQLAQNPDTARIMLAHNSQAREILSSMVAQMQEQAPTDTQEVLQFLKTILAKESLNAAETYQLKDLLGQISLDGENQVLLNMGQDAQEYHVSTTMTGLETQQQDGLTLFVPQFANVLAKQEALTTEGTKASDQAVMVIPSALTLPRYLKVSDQVKGAFAQQFTEVFKDTALFQNGLGEHGALMQGLAELRAAGNTNEKTRALRQIARAFMAMGKYAIHNHVEARVMAPDMQALDAFFARNEIFKNHLKSIGNLDEKEVRVPAQLRTGGIMHYIYLYTYVFGEQFEMEPGIQLFIDQRRTAEFSFAGAA